MKKLITLLAVTAGLAVFAPSSSQAFDGHGHSSSRSFSNNCGSCGTAVYRERVVTGYDRHRHPIYGYRIVSHSCRPRHSSHHHGHSSSFGPSRSSGFHFNLGSFFGRR